MPQIDAPMVLCFTAALTLLIMIPFSANAQESVPKTTEEAQRQFKAADLELNKVYHQCISSDKLGIQTITALQQTQRLWIEYRDINATAFSGKGSKTVWDDNCYYYACTLLTRNRIEELKELFLTPTSRWKQNVNVRLPGDTTYSH